MIHETPTASPRDRRRARNTRRILDEALALVDEGGLEALTVHRLAERLDYTVGALYRYFPGKDAIVVALQRRAVEGFAELFERADAICAARSEGLDPATASTVSLLALGEVYAALGEVSPAEFALHAKLIGDPRALVADEHAAGAVGPILALVAGVADRFARAARSGALRDGPASDRAIVVLAGLHGIVSLRKVTRLQGAGLDTGRLVACHVRGLLTGWGASAKSIDAAARRLADIQKERSLAAAAKQSLEEGEPAEGRAIEGASS